MLKKVTLAGALVAVIAFGAAGCGGDDETTTVAVATKAEFVEQGDVILCTKTDAVAAASASLDPKTATRAELEAFVFEGVLPAVQIAYDDLSALDVPSGDEAQVDAILAAMQAAIENTEDDPAQLITGPDPFGEADGLIADYGLTGCPA
jgi:hypothetical protein